MKFLKVLLIAAVAASSIGLKAAPASTMKLKMAEMYVKTAEERDAPSCALRFGYRYTDPDKWPGMCKALEKNAGAFDEIWFSTGVSFPPLAWHEEHARRCAKAAEDLRKMGVVPSIEIQTIIGHTDDILETGDCSGQDWGTMVSAEGLAARRLSCPRDPRLIAYFTRVAELHAAWRPGSVWIDDDMSYRNRAPLVNCSIDRQEPVDVVLRGVRKGVSVAVWHTPECEPVEIPLEREGESVRMRLPEIGAWSCGYVDFKKEK